MTILTFVIATTITMSANLPYGQHGLRMQTRFNSSEVINTVMVQSTLRCTTPDSLKQIDDIKKSIEGTNVARVISASCS